MNVILNEPDESTAIAVAADFLTGPVQITRFLTGLQHFVFEAKSGRDKVVVRLSRRDAASVAEDSVYWSNYLRPLGVPLPKLIHADTTMTRHPFPFVILERLPGQDLGLVIDRLKDDHLRDLALHLARIQSIVTDLPEGKGYGFAPRMEGDFPFSTWQDLIHAEVSRSQKRIRRAGAVDENSADRIRAAAEAFAGYFEGIAPTPFLHDITTKNVIVDGNRLSGIVDVDDLCFGDPIFLVGLIRMALLAHGNPISYADAWVGTLKPDREQIRALDFYTALFSVNFMAELGQRFNRGRAAQVEPSYVERLEGLLDHYVTRLR